MEKILAHKSPLIAVTALGVLLAAFLTSPGWDRAGAHSLKDLFDSSALRRCTFSKLTPSVDTNGTIFTAEGALRGDFVSIVKSAEGGRVVRSHLLLDHTHAYAWSDAMPGVGEKALVTLLADDASEALAHSPIAIHEKLNFECAPRSEDKQTFIPPREVKFQDVSKRLRDADSVHTQFVPLQDPIPGVSK